MQQRSLDRGACDDGADDDDDVPTTEMPTTEAATVDDRYPDVVDAVASESADGTWRFDVTLSSPYDTPERYADAWRVIGDDGVVYGVRELAHDHQDEQPFTRSLGGVGIPTTVSRVTIEARDLRNGWGGGTVDVIVGP